MKYTLFSMPLVSVQFSSGTECGKRWWELQALPKVIWEERFALAQLCNKVPIGYNGTPQIHPQNCRFPFDDHHPHLIHHYSTDRTHHPKRHPDPISRFVTVHFPDTQTDRPTDRPTDGIGDKSTLLALTLAILI